MKRWKVKSFTSGNIYAVRYFEDPDKWVCSCKAHSFSRIRGENQDCKHIKFIKRKYKLDTL